MRVCAFRGARIGQKRASAVSVYHCRVAGGVQDGGLQHRVAGMEEDTCLCMWRRTLGVQSGGLQQRVAGTCVWYGVRSK